MGKLVFVSFTLNTFGIQGSNWQEAPTPNLLQPQGRRTPLRNPRVQAGRLQPGVGQLLQAGLDQVAELDFRCAVSCEGGDQLASRRNEVRALNGLRDVGIANLDAEDVASRPEVAPCLASVRSPLVHKACSTNTAEKEVSKKTSPPHKNTTTNQFDRPRRCPLKMSSSTMGCAQPQPCSSHR